KQLGSKIGSKKSTGHRGGRRNLANHVRSNHAGGDVDTFTFGRTSSLLSNMLWHAKRGLRRGGYMPQYIFSIRAGDKDAPVARVAELNDDAAAFAHACEIVSELMQGLTHADRCSLVKVRDETRRMVFSIPFLAACA